MSNLTSLTVAMNCSGENPLATGASGTINGTVVTVTSSSWAMNPTPGDGRTYYVIQVGTGRSWGCECTAFANNTATFNVTATSPC